MILDEAGQIASAAVDEGHDETEDIGTVAIDKIPGAIVAEQSLKVDGVSDATVTADAIIAAVAAALKGAGIDPADYDTEVAGPAEEAYAFNPNATPPKAPVTGSITVTDAKGREVVLDLPISTYAISTMDVIDFLSAGV